MGLLADDKEFTDATTKANNLASRIDTTQVATKMTKEAKDKAQDEQSSQQTISDPTKDHVDLTIGVGHKPTHQLFYLWIF